MFGRVSWRMSAEISSLGTQASRVVVVVCAIGFLLICLVFEVLAGE
jgi:hypothetical protein